MAEKGVMAKLLGKEKSPEIDLSKVPEPLSVRSFPEWQKLHTRIEELEARQEEAQTRLTVIGGELGMAEDRSVRILALLSDTREITEARAADRARRQALRDEQEWLTEELDLIEGAITQGRADLSELEYDLARQAAAPVAEWHEKLIPLMAYHVRELCRLARAELKAMRAVAGRFQKPNRLLKGGGQVAPEFSRGEENKGVPALGWIGSLMKAGYLPDDFDMSGTGWGGKDD